MNTNNIQCEGPSIQPHYVYIYIDNETIVPFQPPKAAKLDEITLNCKRSSLARVSSLRKQRKKKTSIPPINSPDGVYIYHNNFVIVNAVDVVPENNKLYPPRR